MSSLAAAARIAVEVCMGISREETVLIITDEPCRKIGYALWNACRNLCREAILTEIAPRKLSGQEPPPPVAEIMKNVDVVICPASTSFTHTAARREACQRGTRVGTMPGITEQMMVRTLGADYRQIAELTGKVARVLSRGKTAHLTTSLGTDLHIPIGGVSALASTGIITKPGAFGNLPSGEAYLMPEEGKAEGVFFVDGSLAGIGRIKQNLIKITVQKGLAVKIEGGPEAQKLKRMIEQAGSGSRNLAELGVGTNDRAQITGAILEDEKVRGTVHLALGNNLSMGGTVSVGFHVDGILTRPTLKIDGKPLLTDGRLLV